MSILSQESKLEFQLGGPAYRLMQRMGLIRGEGPSIGRRMIGFLLITWIPLLILALIEGLALGPTPRESLLLDFPTYARFFLAVPLLFLSEVIVGPRLQTAGLNFVRGNFVRPEDMPAVEAAILRAWGRREALLPELLMLGFALIGAWQLTMDTWIGEASAATWRTSVTEAGTTFTWAGLWYHFVAVPLLQFFLFRWIWRLVSWTLFLRDMARLDLDLVPTHPDRAAGLGFLGGAHLSLAIFPFLFSCVLSAHVAFQVYFEAVPVMSFKVVFAVYLVAMLLLILGPLLIFSPLLARARRQGLRQYSLLSNDYNRAFHQKWVAGTPPADEPLLGSADIQSLADLGNSFGMIREMKIFPFSQQQILQMAVVACLPGLPLIFLVMPVGEILQLLAGALL
ncbi:MAG: hypothetical protein WAT36_12975 [Chromatiaceae bacterium]